MFKRPGSIALGALPEIDCKREMYRVSWSGQEISEEQGISWEIYDASCQAKNSSVTGFLALVPPGFAWTQTHNKEKFAHLF